MATQILHRDNLPLGGFAGLKEHQLVKDPKAFGMRSRGDAWSGIGNFVYLADANFNPKGETHLHDHKEVDVISVMVEGRINHEGTLEHGQEIKALDVQVQRAGGEGFSHNEINPDDTENRMIQIWVLPEHEGERAGYKTYSPKRGRHTRVYGGSPDQNETLASKTTVEVDIFNKGEELDIGGPYMAYLTKGKALIEDGREVSDGDLLRGDSLHLSAETEVELIVIQATE